MKTFGINSFSIYQSPRTSRGVELTKGVKKGGVKTTRSQMGGMGSQLMTSRPAPSTLKGANSTSSRETSPSGSSIMVCLCPGQVNDLESFERSRVLSDVQFIQYSTHLDISIYAFKLFVLFFVFFVNHNHSNFSHLCVIECEIPSLHFVNAFLPR